MLTIWNRKELMTTYDLKQQAKIRELLSSHQIDYMVKVVNRKSPSPLGAGSRARTGTFGEDLNMQNAYIIYVLRKDYERAKEIQHLILA